MRKQVVIVVDINSLRDEEINNEKLGKQLRRMVVSVNSGNNNKFMKFIGFCNVDKQTHENCFTENLQRAVRDTNEDIIYNSIKPFPVTTKEVIEATVELAKSRVQNYNQS